MEDKSNMKKLAVLALLACAMIVAGCCCPFKKAACERNGKCRAKSECGKQASDASKDK